MTTRKARNAAPPEVAAGDIAIGAVAGKRVPGPRVELHGGDVLATLRDLFGRAVKPPVLVLEQEAALARDLISVLTGSSQIAPEPGDKRFQDAAWQSNPVYHALLQWHLAWGRALGGLVERSGLEGAGKERARFAVSLLTDALAPSNALIGNPGALKKVVDTGGKSVIGGIRNMLRDLYVNQGMPAQVDMKAFEVGRNLGISPGAVVFRSEVMELIQYAPATAQVYERAQLLVPPQVNKFYVFDISPGKSIVEFLVGSGFQTFIISWRNPTPAQRDWGMDTYAEALLEAISVVRQITAMKEVNLHGACSGAMTMAALLGHLAETRQPLVKAATMMVALLDSRAESQLGTFVTPTTIAAAKRWSKRKGVLEGKDMGRIFAWMRPNDLVWNYWVNNYLLGNPPPVFDILYWNNDSTRLSARFHAEMLDIFAGNLLVQPGGFTVLGTPIDLSKVRCDKYFVSGITDHITPWKGVFNAARALGGKNEFILSSSGHIQSLINPPGNPKSKFFTNSSATDDPEEWLAGAVPTAGTWWSHWGEWLKKRSGKQRAAPAALGSRKHPPREAAPGTYVHEH